MTSRPVFKILVSLDTILDVRLAVYNRLFDGFENKVTHDEFVKRDIEGFNAVGISHADWTTAYRNRDVGDIRRSKPTAIIEFLKALILRQLRNIHISPQAELVEVDINYWPYKLTEPERKDIKQTMLAVLEHLDEGSIRLVKLSNEQLTPRLMTSSYDCVYLSDFHEWKLAQGESLENATTSNRSTTVIAPLLFRDDNAVEKSVAERIDLKDAAYRLSQVMIPLFNLNLTPIDRVSVIKSRWGEIS